MSHFASQNDGGLLSKIRVFGGGQNALKSLCNKE
jgi:hypothetical protein